MAYDGATYLEDDPQIFQRRLADYVRPYPTKTLAQMIGCEPRTAEHFRQAESWPNARHWKMIVRAFGRDVIAAVFDPEITDTLARLRREEAQLEERLDEVRRRRRSAVGGVDQLEERRDAAVDRAAEVGADLFDHGRSC